MKTCNMIKKEGAKVSYPRIRKKTFETLIKKTTKKKEKEKREREKGSREESERNRRERQKKLLEKSDLIPICF